jgi:orotidine-5'-phosphate decarboxylase
MTNGFMDRLTRAQQEAGSLLCVGLDPDPSRIPDLGGSPVEQLVRFNRQIIEATSDLVCCYKPNLAFYLPYGPNGVEALLQVRRDVPPEIPVLLDAKTGDIASTSRAYATAFFDQWGFDAVTVNPLLGEDALRPFLDYPDRGVFILARTSNPGSALLQERMVLDAESAPTQVSHFIARRAVGWSTKGNVGLVVGATWPDELAAIRTIAPELPFLVPGVGAQAGDLRAAIQAGRRQGDDAGLIINVGRSVLYASSGTDFQRAAREAANTLRNEIEAARNV